MLLNKNNSLKNLNTFGVDVKAKLFAEVFSEDEISDLLADEKINRERKLILGSGSNILFTKDFDGLVIKLSAAKILIVEEDADFVLVEAGAGVIWDELVKYCVGRNFGGVENLTLIPGTIGAAPIQNIGAYGQELADNFDSLRGVFIKSAKKKSFTKSDCRYPSNLSMVRLPPCFTSGRRDCIGTSAVCQENLPAIHQYNLS